MQFYNVREHEGKKDLSARLVTHSNLSFQGASRKFRKINFRQFRRQEDHRQTSSRFGILHFRRFTNNQTPYSPRTDSHL
jgi:hypothetical protein